MEPVEMLIRECRGANRRGYIVEQGIPVPPMIPEEAGTLAVLDGDGIPVSANVQIEARDRHGRVRWVLVSLPVDLEVGEEKRFHLKENEGRDPASDRLQCDLSPGAIVLRNRFFALELSDPGSLRLTTESGTVLDGDVGFEIRSDARSAVGNLRPVCYEPNGYEILGQTPKRAHVLLKGRYRAWTPKAFSLDPVQRFDAELEMTVYADSPVIRFRWRITDLMRFNCPYMWLDRYLLSFPLAGECEAVDGDAVPDEDKFASWAAVRTTGGEIAMAFPFHEWLGKGAGVEVKDGRIGQGGINPPPDGGFGGKSPDIWRKFYYGMSRTFEGSLIVNGSPDQVQAELKPIPIIVTPKHYSECGALPEDGSEVTFGPWKKQIDRAAEHLLESQWKGTLWFGEWWRERDVDHDLGVEETNSGNSALGPLYHFYRTGDWRFWESAKMSYYYTYDIQFCKREDGDGPYMHTRRFLLDHQEWFHPRYQRIGGIIRPSHLFGDRRTREKIIWMVRYWAERYVADDGSPMTPNRDGTVSKCAESAMSNFADSLMHAYVETGDEFFLDRARRMGDWVVRGAEADLDRFCENSNSTRYILRGLLQLCKETDDQRYRDTFAKIAEWTVNAPTFDYGTHYVAFHFYYASQAYKWSGRKEILDGILRLAEWVLSRESPDAPGTYPFVQKNQYPPARWICIYDNKAIVAYLPVLAATLAEARENREL